MNLQTMAQTLVLIQDSHENNVIEVRNRNTGMHGYFDNLHECITAITSNGNEHYTWQVILNDIPADIYKHKYVDKDTHTQIQTLNQISKGEATKNTDITHRKWLFIDIDNHQTKDSATDEERQFTYSIVLHLLEILKRENFPEPLIADSGNGYHILYRIDLPNNDYITNVIKNFYEALEKVNPGTAQGVTIDTQTGTASSMVKIYGVKSSRGKETKERPHRYSKLIQSPNGWKQPEILNKNTILKFTAKYGNNEL